MAAAYRGRKAAYWRRKRPRQTQSRKIQARRKKLRSKQKRKTRTLRAIRFVRIRYQPRRNTTTRYFNRRLRDRVFSRQKTRYPGRSYSRKAYRRKPRRVGRPRKKRCSCVCPRYLHASLNKVARKKQANPPGAAAIKRRQRKTRSNEDEIFYSMANTSTLEGTSEEKQSKKHPVHPANSTNTKTKEMEQHLQEDSVDNQQGQQPVVPKKRGRNSATPVYKSR